jgi:hypothetical protein
VLRFRPVGALPHRAHHRGEPPRPTHPPFHRCPDSRREFSDERDAGERRRREESLITARGVETNSRPKPGTSNWPLTAAGVCGRSYEIVSCSCSLKLGYKKSLEDVVR